MEKQPSTGGCYYRLHEQARLFPLEAVAVNVWLSSLAFSPSGISNVISIFVCIPFLILVPTTRPSRSISQKAESGGTSCLSATALYRVESRILAGDERNAGGQYVPKDNDQDSFDAACTGPDTL
jgi:hypothetical protein